MKVLLRRPLFLEGQLFLQSNSGTEIPEELNGKRIVLKKDWVRGEEGVIPLPSDAIMFDEKVAATLPPETTVRKAQPLTPVPLSSLTPKTPKKVGNNPDPL